MTSLNSRRYVQDGDPERVIITCTSQLSQKAIPSTPLSDSLLSDPVAESRLIEVQGNVCLKRCLTVSTITSVSPR